MKIEPVLNECIPSKTEQRRKNIPFDLTIEDFVIPDKCPILDVPLVRSSTGVVKQNSPSIDRIKPKLGYIKGNVRVISYGANRTKSNYSVDVFKRLVIYMGGIN